MKLYYVPGTCSLLPHIVLRELNLPFTLDRVDVKAGKKTQSGAQYTAINPKGYVPALELEGGQVLTEGAVIAQYLADLKPDAKLLPPAGSLERVRAQEWMHFIATELHKGMSPLYPPVTPSEFKEWWKENRLSVRFEHLSKSLEGRQYLVGDAFTVVDAYAFYVLRAWQTHHQGDLSRWKPLADFHARIGERPSVKASLEAESAPG